jgi:hypothetical protein|nr:hypothetical protein [Neorhizobium tomejilense]
MSIFVVFRTKNSNAVRAALEELFPRDYLEVQDGEFLISANMTAQELSENIGISGGSNGSAIIFKMASYHGRATTEIWDWIKTKAEVGD